MPTTLTIKDETASGQTVKTFTLDCLTERITVRELIRARIHQEVQDYNLKEPEYFRGLVEPKRTNEIILPFEGDRTLSVIQSKAFLLSADDKIKDSAILSQIKG